MLFGTVKGLEAKVIEGGLATSEKYKPEIFVEVRSRKKGNTLDQIINVLLPMGYYLYTSKQTDLENFDERDDVIFSTSNKKILDDIENEYEVLNRKEKLVRIFKRILLLQLSDLHHQAIRILYKVYY